MKLINSMKKRSFNSKSSDINSYDNFQTYVKKDLNNRLNVYLKAIENKLDIVNGSYEKARLQIETNCRKTSEEINDAVNNLVNMIMEKKYIMLKDVEARKVELLIDFKERYENNPKVKLFRNEINSEYALITNELDREKYLDEDEEILGNYMQRFQMLNSKIDENVKYIPLNIDVNTIQYVNQNQSQSFTYDSDSNK